MHIIFIARSRILSFHPGERPDPKTMPSARPLPSTTNEDQALGFHPENHGLVLEDDHLKFCPPVLSLPHTKVAAAKSQHTTHRKTCVTIFVAEIFSLSLQASKHSHHDFLHHRPNHENLYRLFHGNGKAAKLRSTPFESILAEAKGVHNQINSDLDIERRHARIICGNLRG